MNSRCRPTRGRDVGKVIEMKSYTLKVHETVRLMAYQTVLPKKTVYVGLTITIGMTQVTPIGQEVLNAIAAYAENGNLTMFQLSEPKNTLKRFRAAMGQLKDGDAIVVMAEKDGLSGPILKALDIQREPADLPQKYTLAEDSSVVQAMIKDLSNGEPNSELKAASEARGRAA